MNGNRRRFLAEALSIDAWHQPFRTDTGSSAVYVDITFHEGRIGGSNDDMPFTFKITLKRALLTINLEHPLKLDRGTIARGIPSNESDLTALLRARAKTKQSQASRGRMEATSFSAALADGQNNSNTDQSRERLEVVQSIPKILVTPRPGGSSMYSWDLLPSYEEFLDGQPWHPSEEPRFHIKGLTKPSAIDPSVRVTLTCALEDIGISDFTPKKAGIIEKLRLKAQNEMSEAAAIQYLKLTLRDAELEVGNLDNKFSDLKIAEIFAWSE